MCVCVYARVIFDFYRILLKWSRFFEHVLADGFIMPYNYALDSFYSFLTGYAQSFCEKLLKMHTLLM